MGVFSGVWVGGCVCWMGASKSIKHVILCVAICLLVRIVD